MKHIYFLTVLVQFLEIGFANWLGWFKRKENQSKELSLHIYHIQLLVYITSVYFIQHNFWNPLMNLFFTF